MGPEFFAAPTKNEWDGETCTSPFMENVLWEQGTEPGYISGPNGTAGTVLVGGAGVNDTVSFNKVLDEITHFQSQSVARKRTGTQKELLIRIVSI